MLFGILVFASCVIDYIFFSIKCWQKWLSTALKCHWFFSFTNFVKFGTLGIPELEFWYPNVFSERKSSITLQYPNYWTHIFRFTGYPPTANKHALSANFIEIKVILAKEQKQMWIGGLFQLVSFKSRKDVSILLLFLIVQTTALVPIRTPTAALPCLLGFPSLTSEPPASDLFPMLLGWLALASSTLMQRSSLLGCPQDLPCLFPNSATWTMSPPHTVGGGLRLL
jgi:hypothetical protein